MREIAPVKRDLLGVPAVLSKVRFFRKTTLHAFRKQRAERLTGLASSSIELVKHTNRFVLQVCDQKMSQKDFERNSSFRRTRRHRRLPGSSIWSCNGVPVAA